MNYDAVIFDLFGTLVDNIGDDGLGAGPVGLRSPYGCEAGLWAAGVSVLDRKSQ